MMFVRIVSALLGLLCAVGAASAQSDRETLVCTFRDGTAATQVDGAFKQTPASPIIFELKDIDLDAETAKIAAKPGADPMPLRIVRALNANHFIEVLTEGFLSLTTIYDKNGATNEFPAVHSRHVGIFGQAVVAQYTGTCKAN